MKVEFLFAWYDFWIGFFFDKKKKTLYICPLPCCVLRIHLKPKDETPVCTPLRYQRSSVFYELTSRTSARNWIGYMRAALDLLEWDLYMDGLLENKLVDANTCVSKQHVEQQVIFAVDVDQNYKIVCNKCGQVWSKHSAEDFGTYKCPVER